MNFISLSYLLFVPIVLGLVRVVPAAGRVWVLLGASYVFYGAWDVRFLGLVWLSTGVDYVVARRMAASDDDRLRRRLLGGIVVTQDPSGGIYQAASSNRSESWIC